MRSKARSAVTIVSPHRQVGVPRPLTNRGAERRHKWLHARKFGGKPPLCRRSAPSDSMVTPNPQLTLGANVVCLLRRQERTVRRNFRSKTAGWQPAPRYDPSVRLPVLVLLGRGGWTSSEKAFCGITWRGMSSSWASPSPRVARHSSTHTSCWVFSKNCMRKR